MSVRLSIIIPTAGRETLAGTIRSLAGQLVDGDEVLVLRRDTPWGNAARDEGARKATGSHLLFIDDDDEYLPGALDHVRTVASDAMHVFRMRGDRDGLLWTEQTIAPGQIGTPMVCLPNEPLPEWAADNSAQSDYVFFAKCAETRPVVWHEEVIATIRP